MFFENLEITLSQLKDYIADDVSIVIVERYTYNNEEQRLLRIDFGLDLVEWKNLISEIAEMEVIELFPSANGELMIFVTDKKEEK